MKPRFLLCATVAGALALPLAAQTDKPLESDSVFRLTGSGTVRFDDNILLESATKESDTVFLLTPGIQWAAGNGAAKGSLAASEQFVRYASHAGLNSNLADVEGSASFEGALAQAAVQAAYREIDQNNLSLRTVAGNAASTRRNLTSFGANGQWSTTPKTKVGLGVAFESAVYPNPGFTNSRTWSAPLDLYYSVTPKLDLSLGDRYQRSTFSNGLNDSKDHFFSVGARGDFTAKLSGQVRVGVDRLKFDSGGSTNQFGLGASLTYAYSPKTSFELSASNDYRSSALGTAQKVFSTGLAGHFALTPQWSAQARASFDSTRYLTDRPTDLVNGRRDDFYVWDFSVTYAWTANVAFNLGWVFRKNASTDDRVDFDNNVVSVSVSAQY